MSKYQALTDYLLANSNLDTIQLTFDSINSIIYPQSLPASAYIYREWWGNDGYHAQANAWYKAGFLVSKVDNETVFFTNSNTERCLVISNTIPSQTKMVACPICNKQFDSHSINDHIRYAEKKYFGDYIRFQTSKFVCGICYGIINNFTPSYLQIHKDKKCLENDYC